MVLTLALYTFAVLVVVGADLYVVGAYNQAVSFAQEVDRAFANVEVTQTSVTKMLFYRSIAVFLDLGRSRTPSHGRGERRPAACREYAPRGSLGDGIRGVGSGD